MFSAKCSPLSSFTRLSSGKNSTYLKHGVPWSDFLFANPAWSSFQQRYSIDLMYGNETWLSMKKHCSRPLCSKIVHIGLGGLEKYYSKRWEVTSALVARDKTKTGLRSTTAIQLHTQVSQYTCAKVRGKLLHCFCVICIATNICTKCIEFYWNFRKSFKLLWVPYTNVLAEKTDATE